MSCSNSEFTLYKDNRLGFVSSLGMRWVSMPPRLLLFSLLAQMEKTNELR